VALHVGPDVVGRGLGLALQGAEGAGRAADRRRPWAQRLVGTAQRRRLASCGAIRALPAAGGSGCDASTCVMDGMGTAAEPWPWNHGAAGGAHSRRREGADHPFLRAARGARRVYRARRLGLAERSLPAARLSLHGRRPPRVCA